MPRYWLARPALPWRRRLWTGLTLFAGQFLLLFFAYEAGMPPGLASVTQELHAFFTVLLAALLLGERPSRRQWTGIAVAFAGLGLIALTLGGNGAVFASLRYAGMALILAGLATLVLPIRPATAKTRS